MSSAVQRGAPERCATRAALRGDPMIGTAFPASRVLLVEQPGAWGRRGLRDSEFPADLADLLERRAAAAGVRVQAVRRPGRLVSGAASGPRAWALVDTRPGRRQARWGTWRDPAELVDLPLDGTVGIRDDRPVMLVCAHSKHDVCCALRGRPVADALADLLPGRVWETSHLGGDRFAANVLALPLGVLYGRVLPFATADLVAATERGEVIAQLLRGHIGLPPAAQAALAHAHLHLNLSRVDDLSVVTTGAFHEGVATVVLRGPAGPLDVAVRAERVPATGLTCQNPAPGSFWAYRVIGADPRVSDRTA